MYDDILRLVKERFGNDPDVASAISPDKVDAVHEEIAMQITRALENQSTPDTQPQQKGKGGSKNITGKAENSVASGNVDASAIERGLVSSLKSKFGLPPSVTGAIAGALPGLLQELDASHSTVS